MGLEEVPLNDDERNVSVWYFFVGLLLALFLSVLSLFAMFLHPGLRESPMKRRKFMTGVVTACAIHFVIVLALVTYFWMRKPYTPYAG